MAKEIQLPKRYEIPPNWKWVELEKVCFIRSGFPFDSARFSDYKPGYRPLVRIRDVLRGATTTYTDEECSDDYIVHNGDILVGMDGDFNVAKWSSGDALLNQRVCYICSLSEGLLNDYLFYFLFEPLKKINEVTPSVTVKHLSTKTLGKVSVPIPPLSEQHRIVAHIESLFSKLDMVMEKAQAVIDSYEDRKAAILHKAFSGELTVNWRQSIDSQEAWKQISVKDVCIEVKVGIVIKPSQYYTKKNNGTAAFRSANVREFHVDDFDWVYLDENGMRLNQRSIVHTGDVLVVRSGNPGTACVVDDVFDGFNAIDVLIAVPNQELITSEYLCAFTNSPMGRKLVAENKRGMALAHFNVSGYSKLVIPLPSIEEQKAIINVLFKLLDKEQKIKESAESIVDKIDSIKQSILTRAFHGTLGTNDHDDESAEITLRTILSSSC